MQDQTTISVNGGPEVPLKDTKKAMKEMAKILKDNKGRHAAAEGTVSGQRLKSYLERIERLTEEQKSLAEDIKDIYSESKSAGFEPKIIRKLVSLRKTSPEKRREEQELLELYASAIGQGDLFA